MVRRFCKTCGEEIKNCEDYILTATSIGDWECRSCFFPKGKTPQEETPAVFDKLEPEAEPCLV